MSDDAERVRSRLNIVDVVGRRLSLKKAGKDYKGLCPFHNDRTPSMHVTPSMGIYKCFACGAGGDAFKFVMEFHRVDFKEALEMLAEEVGVTLTKGGSSGPPSQRPNQLAAVKAAQDFFVKQLGASPVAQKYCEGRGLTPAVVEQWGIGFAPTEDGALASHLAREGFSLALCQELFLVQEDTAGGFYDRFRGRLMFPIWDESGRVVAFGGRLLASQSNAPKYINSGDTPLFNKRRLLYGMNLAKEAWGKKEQAVLVEGYLDVIACHRAGVTEAVASLGTSLSEDHAKMLARWVKRVIVLYDADQAGQKAAERASQLLEAEGLLVRVALMPTGEDPDTLLKEKGASAVLASVDQALSPLEFRVTQLKRTLDPSTEEFWKEFSLILAGAPNHRDVVGLVDEAVAFYPFTKDRERARRAIESDIKLARKTLAADVESKKASTHLRINRSNMPSWESLLLRAVVSVEHFRFGWDAVRQWNLFQSQDGRRLAQTLFETVPEEEQSHALPVTKISGSEWGLVLAEMESKSLVPLTMEALNDALQKLRSQDQKEQIRGLVANSPEENLEEIQRIIKARTLRQE